MRKNTDAVLDDIDDIEADTFAAINEILTRGFLASATSIAAISGTTKGKLYERSIIISAEHDPPGPQRPDQGHGHAVGKPSWRCIRPPRARAKQDARARKRRADDRDGAETIDL